MVEGPAGPSTAFLAMTKSAGCMQTIFEFLTPLQGVQLQLLCKRFYNEVVPKANVKVELPQLTLVMESGRKTIALGYWKDKSRQCQLKPLLKIGSGEGEVSAETLGFDEVYFQYFVRLNGRVFLAWRLEIEALLKKGYKVSFDSKMKFEKSEPIAELGENTMRPTAVVLKKGAQVLMLGGRQDRSSQLLDLATDTWTLSPKLPLGHNITTNISVNWKDKAVFTFIIDAQLTIKSAVLDLERAEFTPHDTENTAEMEWALQLQ